MRAKFAIVSRPRVKSVMCNEFVSKSRLDLSLLLLHESDPRAELAAHSIVKSAKGLAVGVVLKVSRVEVIGEIEDFQAQLQTIILKSSHQTNGFEYLKIKRDKLWIKSREISRANKIPVLLNGRVGESGARTQNWCKRHAIGDV